MPNDPVSCLLCLDAFERPTMLRINLRPIAGGDPHEYYLCQRCGGSIAAEYLYIQNSTKSESSGASPEPDLRPYREGNGVENPPAAAPTRVELDAPAAVAIGEAETVAATREKPKSGKRM